MVPMPVRADMVGICIYINTNTQYANEPLRIYPEVYLKSSAMAWWRGYKGLGPRFSVSVGI